jgi:DNA-binding transcriptional regulator YiaG
MDIRKIRKKLGLTQEEFAKELGVCPTTISRWENKHQELSGLAIKRIRGFFIERRFQRHLR